MYTSRISLVTGFYINHRTIALPLHIAFSGTNRQNWREMNEEVLIHWQERGREQRKEESKRKEAQLSMLGKKSNNAVK